MHTYFQLSSNATVYLLVEHEEKYFPAKIHVTTAKLALYHYTGKHYLHKLTLVIDNARLMFGSRTNYTRSHRLCVRPPGVYSIYLNEIVAINNTEENSGSLFTPGVFHFPFSAFGRLLNDFTPVNILYK